MTVTAAQNERWQMIPSDRARILVFILAVPHTIADVDE
jgi:hypothetical protein